MFKLLDTFEVVVVKFLQELGLLGILFRALWSIPLFALFDDLAQFFLQENEWDL